MALRVNFPEFGEVTADSAAELIAFKKALENERNKHVHVEPKQLSIATINDQGSKDGVPEAIKFLNALRKAGIGIAVTGKELVPILGVNHPKGLGSVLARIKSAIRLVGHDPAEAFSQARGTSRGREYRGQPGLPHVLLALQAHDL